MGNKTMVAAARMTYGRRALQANDEFEASDKDAAIFERVGKAKPKEVAEETQPTPAEPAKKRTYKTRMLTAETGPARDR